MNISRSLFLAFFALVVLTVAICPGTQASAAERVTSVQPVLIPGGHYTRLLGAAPLKPPVLFADDDEAVAAHMETVGWYRHGAPTFAYYRGFGGWYGPWYGYRSYPYWGGYYGGYYGYLGGNPFGYYGSSPVGFSYPYGVGYQPWGAYPSYSPVFYPPAMMGVAGIYPGSGMYGGCCYW
jgi:hypothetical protein